jgi:hypothetical protein
MTGTTAGLLRSGTGVVPTCSAPSQRYQLIEVKNFIVSFTGLLFRRQSKLVNIFNAIIAERLLPNEGYDVDAV